jgi:Uncharacterized protein conserved in bacteria
MPLKYNGRLVPYARDLRKQMTAQEKFLWYKFLRNHNPRFQRQKVIDNFIVDFYCGKAKLAIEIDGNQHYTEDGLAYDKERTTILNASGLVVLRFTNADIINNFDALCTHISEKVKERIKKN